MLGNSLTVTATVTSGHTATATATVMHLGGVGKQMLCMRGH
jgi:hypothetical protein